MWTQHGHPTTTLFLVIYAVYNWKPVGSKIMQLSNLLRCQTYSIYHNFWLFWCNTKLNDQQNWATITHSLLVQLKTNKLSNSKQTSYQRERGRESPYSIHCHVRMLSFYIVQYHINILYATIRFCMATYSNSFRGTTIDSYLRFHTWSNYLPTI